MKLGYSEFSYGYAFTENLVRSSASAPTGAPRFPNLIEEGQLGYDVRIDLPALPLFFQFKLPELMVRSTASEIAKVGGALQVPFFRVPLMRRDDSHQHAILIALEQKYPGSVFYAATRMPSVSAFNDGYNSCEAHVRSVLISPKDIGPLTDNKKHTVSYGLSGQAGWFCSEPQEIALTDFAALARDSADRFRAADTMALAEITPKLVKALQSIRPSPSEAIVPSTSLAAGTLPEFMEEAIEIEATPAVFPDEEAIRGRFRAFPRAKLDQPAQQAEQKVAEDLYVARELARISLGVQLMIAQPASE